ncbi:hypothetical protein AC579_3595 [Pseudocercospora musae]|uniref:SnoaL-like domain-containing protein n=1 Tax=Pseudocercospora musae TaxID=113226 RepID=A0A139GU13_9PEZI|nr:hypothetical protein AC579_3595 [Pseudocercospora musae]
MPIPHSTSRLSQPVGTIALPPTNALAARHPSLELLCPGLDHPPQSSKPPASMTATALYISHLIDTLSALMCSEEGLSDPLLWQHIGADLQADASADPTSAAVKGYASLAFHLSQHREMLKRMPDYQLEVVENVVQVYANGMKAKAWSFKKVSGLPAGVCTEQVSSTTWERQGEDKTWVVTNMDLLRGIAGYD